MPTSAPSDNLHGTSLSPSVAVAGDDFDRPSVEPKAHAVIEQQLLLRAKLRDAPTAMAGLAGADHLVSVANNLFRQLFGGRALAGLALRTALPELAEQPFFSLLDEAYRTGVTSYGHEAVAYTDPAGRSGPLYFTFMAQPVQDAAGAVTGLLLFAYNVSAHVLARAPESASGPQPTATTHELALANEELATTNEELLVSNEELAATNAQLSTANAQLQASNAEVRAQAKELRLAHNALRQLNQQLEDRVAERTVQLQNALSAAEQAAAQRESSHQVFEETSAVIVILRGPEHRIEYHNSAYQKLFVGRAQRGRRMAEMAPETERQGFVALLNRVYETGQTYFGVEVPLVMEQPGGEPTKTHYFNFTYQRFEEDGQPAGISVFAYDVAEQVLARRDREAQLSELSELFQQAPVAIAVVRGSQYIMDVANPLMAQLWGRTPEQVLGKTLYDALPEVRDQGFKERLDQVMVSGEAFVAQEVPAQLLRAGQLAKVYLNFVYQPLRDTQGRIDRVAAVATDVTAQVMARKQLAQINTELTATNRQLNLLNTHLDSFVYAASHDLKLPVLNLAGLFDELRRSVTFTDAAEEALLLPLITQALHQLSTSLDDLAALGNAQQMANTTAEPVLLDDLVEEILHTLEPQVRAANARITTDFAVRLTLTYPRASLHTIVLNLLSNALKYADPNRPARIHCSLWLSGNEPVLYVKDNGIGFDAAGHSPELFQLFRRFHTHVEGTGVGLYLVNRLLLANGGHLEVDSQVGAGATFRAYLGHS